MKRIIQANIDHFKQLLETEGDLSKRAMLLRLLAEHETKLKEVKKTPVIVRLNIDYYQRKLAEETDPTRRQIIIGLLAKEGAKLAAIEAKVATNELI